MPPVLKSIQRFPSRRGRLRSIPVPVLFRTCMAMLAGFFLSEMLLKSIPLFRRRYDGYEGMVEIYLHGIVEAEA